MEWRRTTKKKTYLIASGQEIWTQSILRKKKNKKKRIPGRNKWCPRIIYYQKRQAEMKTWRRTESICERGAQSCSPLHIFLWQRRYFIIIKIHTNKIKYKIQSFAVVCNISCSMQKSVQKVFNLIWIFLFKFIAFSPSRIRRPYKRDSLKELMATANKQLPECRQKDANNGNEDSDRKRWNIISIRMKAIDCSKWKRKKGKSANILITHIYLPKTFHLVICRSNQR